MSLLKYTADIVRSYVSRNEIKPEDVPELLVNIHKSLQLLADVPVVALEATGQDDSVLVSRSTVQGQNISSKREPEPAVSISDAVTEDSIICMICGKSNKAIRGHLSRTHGMTVENYRTKFNLPNDFLMVAPSYSARRRQLAIDAGLGEKLQAGRKRSRKAK